MNQNVNLFLIIASFLFVLGVLALPLLIIPTMTPTDLPADWAAFANSSSVWLN